MRLLIGLLAAALVVSALVLLVHWPWREAGTAARPKVTVEAGIRSIAIGLNASGSVKIVVRPVDPPAGYLKLAAEEERVLELQCDGRCAVKVEVAGGRGYNVTVVSGEGRAAVYVPYVREFDDLASELAKRGVVVSAAYMPWRMAEVLGPHWRGDVPLLGLYDTSSDYVQWRHIDWARGHGVHVFWVDWTMYASTEAGERIFQVTRGLLEKVMVVGVMLGLR